MIYLFLLTLGLLIFSFVADRDKTYKALRIAAKKFINISALLIIVLILVSIVLFFISGDTISKYLSNGNKYIALTIASVLGSITMLPGFIAFPLSGILKENGVFYMVISAFTTTLMMVGILTFPVEREYFGAKVALLRNVMSFFIAIAVAIITGIFFGEVF